MKQFSLFSKNGEIVQSYAIQVGRIIDEHFSEAKKQTAIHDFFKKVVKKVICMLFEYRRWDSILKILVFSEFPIFEKKNLVPCLFELSSDEYCSFFYLFYLV